MSRPNRAYTTIELLGAIVISMIVGTIALSGYRVYEQQMPVGHVARRLTHAFTTARAMAVAQDSYYTVQIHLQQGNFWIDETDESGGVVAHKVVHPEPIDDKVVVDSVLLGSGEPAPIVDNMVSIRFTPDGSSDDIRILLRLAVEGDQASDFYTVRLYGPTGLGRVFKNQKLAPSPI